MMDGVASWDSTASIGSMPRTGKSVIYGGNDLEPPVRVIVLTRYPRDFVRFIEWSFISKCRI